MQVLYQLSYGPIKSGNVSRHLPQLKIILHVRKIRFGAKLQEAFPELVFDQLEPQ